MAVMLDNGFRACSSASSPVGTATRLTCKVGSLSRTRRSGS